MLSSHVSVNFTTGFPASVRETLPNVITQVDEVELGAEHSPASNKTRGLIQVRGDNLQARLKIVPGFWSANVVVDVDITVAVTVDNGSGRIFGKPSMDGGMPIARAECSAPVVRKP